MNGESIYSQDNKPAKAQNYFVSVDVFSHFTHPITLIGIGENLDFEALQKGSLKEFLKSFYHQMAYFPTFESTYEYQKMAACLGEDVSWPAQYYVYDLSGEDLFKHYRIILPEEGIKLSINVYKLFDNSGIEKDTKVEFLNTEKMSCYALNLSVFGINDLKSMISRTVVILDK